MSDPAPSATAWPAARPTGISPIQHPAWEEARNAILDLAAEGPVTAVIIGEPGTGKTWLLRELASALADHGFPTMLLMQGNLPMAIAGGAALLVDEASMMDAPTRATLSAQQLGVVVLAGTEWVEDDPAAPGPVLIPLRPLDPAETADFATEWLLRAGLPPLTDSALAELAAQTGGRVGPIARSLAAHASARPAVNPFRAALADPPAAALPAADAPPVIPPRRSRRRGVPYRSLAAGSAIAAAFALGWALIPASSPPPTPPSSVADASPPAAASLSELPPAPPAPAATTTAVAPPPPLPPLRTADIPGPALAAAIPVAPAIPAAPLTASSPPPDVASMSAAALAPAAPAAAAAPLPPVPATADPPLLPPAEAATTAIPESPAATPVLPRQPDPAGGPGLVLVAQRGDTLQKLYDSVYRDRKAPPFAKVLAANPGRFKPGAIVVFPEPPGGWQRTQR